MSRGADAIHAGIAREWQQIYQRFPEVWNRFEPGVGAYVTGTPGPAFNGVWVFGLGADPRVVGELADEVASRCDAGGWSFLTRQGDDVSARIAAGLGMESEDVPLMRLDRLDDLDTAVPEGLVVRELAADEHDVHVRLVATCFDMSEDAARSAARFILSVAGVRELVGEVDGVPVATSLVCPFGEDGTSIFNVATLPDHRRRGYGAALTRAACTAAARDGATWAWLQSSPDGFPVYEALGFRTVAVDTQWAAP